MARAARFAIAVLCITRAVTTATASVVSISNKDPRLDTSGKIMVRNAPDCSALLGLLLRAAVKAVYWTGWQLAALGSSPVRAAMLPRFA